LTAAFPLTLGRHTAELEEERRVLYVAMTRAKDNLHLVVPQRFFTHGQSIQGDRHVYASRTVLPRLRSLPMVIVRKGRLSAPIATP
jgi:superfamily I DNA/RNA helicase